MGRREFVAAAAAMAALPMLGACASPSVDPALERNEIDSAVDLALTRLYAQAAGSRELVSKAKGELIVPGVLSAGLVVGGSHGRGALRSGGRTSGYYSASSASIGLIAGAQSQDLFLLFMTEEALERFRSGSGWTAGVDASVAFLDAGASGRLDTESARHQVIGLMLSNGGLIAEASFEGTKFSRLAL